ncbi:MAG: PfkB family carbohydrate kinase [Verrucomicrobiales bacterium]
MASDAATTPPFIEPLLESFSRKRLVVLGDVMLDRFIWGRVNRISPEAPVPVVEVERESLYPGGAANVARNLTPFGATVDLIGMVGVDDNAALFDRVLRADHIRTERLLRVADYPTITKTRVVARQQQVVRVDHERPRPLTTPQIGEIIAMLEEMAPGLDAIVLEDYAKGFLSAAVVEAVTGLAHDLGILVTVDPNPRNPIAWRGVAAVKPNRAEAFHEAGVADPHDALPPMEDHVLARVGERLLEKWDTEHVLITLGEKGMMLFSRSGDRYHIPTRAKEVFDVSGAGDTAIAVFTLALCSGASPRLAADLSNAASGVVVGKLGTAQITPQDLLEAWKNHEE